MTPPFALPEWVRFARHVDDSGRVWWVLSAADAHGNTTGFRVADDVTPDEWAAAVGRLTAFRG